ncbi:MAG: ABC transporter permease [Gemmataceae bacterium]|nr:ABC transporter permease [Gemmataceae bacterium]
MSISFVNLLIACSLLMGVQLLAAIPWLMLNRRTKQRVRTLPFWITGALFAVGGGVVFAFLANANTDAAILARWGRLYASLLQLQLIVDLFVLVFWSMLAAGSKAGAVALAAFQEGLRQPKYWLLFGAAFLLMGASILIPYFTFGEDLKMMKELCYAFTMFMPAGFGVLAAAMSVTEEIEGRTAVTLMSKPISRRQFLLGKYLGTILASLSMMLGLGWWLVWVVLGKQAYDPPIGQEALPDPTWITTTVAHWFDRGSVADLMRGVLLWSSDAADAFPHLLIGFGQSIVMVAIAVALATRFPMIVNLATCLVIYFLGNLTAIMTQVSQGGYRLVYFVAQVFDTVLPGLDLFDVGSAVVRDAPLPPAEFAFYTLNVVLYSLTYAGIAMLFGLILFEDRDLA